MKKIILAALAATTILVGCGSESTTTPAKKESAVKANWTYVETTPNKMTGSVTKLARTESINKVEMKFPYNGGVTGKIVVFKDDVTIYISKGQILCRSYEPCEIFVKFDDEKPEWYSAIGPDNGETTYVFIHKDRDIQKFKNKLATANRVMISMEIYRENSPVWEFNVSGFQPEKL